MKKTTILFLVLVIILSFASCSTASNEEETTVTSTVESTTSEESIIASSVITCIDSVFEEKDSISYGGIKPSIASEVKLHIQSKIEEAPTSGPSFYSIEYLPHPEGTEGFFQISIRFDAVNINKRIVNVIENENPKSELYIKDYSKPEVEKIISSVLKDVENISTSFRYEIIESEYDYCCLVIYN